MLCRDFGLRLLRGPRGAGPVILLRDMRRTIASVLVALFSGCVRDGMAQPRPSPADGGSASSPAPCGADGECGWDDPCVPTRCVAAGSSRPAACRRSAPEPGSCRCVIGACTLQRGDLESTRSPERGCQTSADCDLDRPTGVCRVRAATLAPPANPGDRFCDCDTATGACVQREQAPVSCRSWRDCSWTRSPLRAVPSAQVRRPVPGPVRACRDGSIDSVCERGTCRVVTWGC